MVIGGPAGIGKTALLQAACGMAERAGMRVLRARSSDLEQEFAFGVVRQLFEAPLDAGHAPRSERRCSMAPPRSPAPLFEPGPAGRPTGPNGPTARGQPAEPGPASSRGGPGARGPAVHARAQPVLADLEHRERRPRSRSLVDDCHWADAPSLRFLAYVSARCEELGVLVMRHRSRWRAVDRCRKCWSHSAPTRARSLIEPASLSEGAVTTLVRSALGQHADAGFCAACARASAGNPFLVRELIAELETERVEPVAASAPRVETVRPESVSRAVVARLNRLGADSRNLARSVAVLESASLRQAATLAGIPGCRARAPPID